MIFIFLALRPRWCKEFNTARAGGAPWLARGCIRPHTLGAWVSERFSYYRAAGRQRLADLAGAVRGGLDSSPFSIPPRFFYDDAGSALFEEICSLAGVLPDPHRDGHTRFGAARAGRAARRRVPAGGAGQRPLHQDASGSRRPGGCRPGDRVRSHRHIRRWWRRGPDPWSTTIRVWR